MAGGKRQKLLSTKEKVQEQERNIYDTNANDSPLLNLPAEVRNRIFRFALGGQTSHVAASEQIRTGFFPFYRYHEPKHAFRVYGCQHSQTEDEDAVAIKADRPAKMWLKHSERHADCAKPVWWKKRSGKVSVAVLQACRQIHQEAGLLPFACNTFAFASVDVMQAFMQFLILHQARAVTLISLVHDHLRSIGRHHLSTQLQTLIKSKFKGLRELTCFVEIPPALDANRLGLRFPQNLLREFDQHSVEKAAAVVHQWVEKSSRWGRGRVAVRRWPAMTVPTLRYLEGVERLWEARMIAEG